MDICSIMARAHSITVQSRHFWTPGTPHRNFQIALIATFVALLPTSFAFADCNSSCILRQCEHGQIVYPGTAGWAEASRCGIACAFKCFHASGGHAPSHSVTEKSAAHAHPTAASTNPPAPSPATAASNPKPTPKETKSSLQPASAGAVHETSGNANASSGTNRSINPVYLESPCWAPSGGGGPLVNVPCQSSSPQPVGRAQSVPIQSLPPPPVAQWFDILQTVFVGPSAEAETTQAGNAPAQPLNTSPGAPNSDPGVFPGPVQEPSDALPQQYSNDDPRSHGTLGPPIDTYDPNVPPEPTWLSNKEYQVEQNLERLEKCVTGPLKCVSDVKDWVFGN
jgi:hypothetical protein